MEMIVQMQRDQQSWLEGQQNEQELMQQNQQVQREMMDAVLAARAPSTGATLIQSYCDMFEGSETAGVAE